MDVPAGAVLQQAANLIGSLQVDGIAKDVQIEILTTRVRDLEAEVAELEEELDSRGSETPGSGGGERPGEDVESNDIATGGAEEVRNGSTESG